jgi:ABC-type multidrug transport system ATPase subunit
VAHAGELLAIMGASGAGKTTLLNTLMFRSPPSLQVSGRRTLNGVFVSSSTLASLSAYVQQHDLFIGTLTVREHLIFQVVMASTPTVRNSGVIVSNFPYIKEESLSNVGGPVIFVLPP